MEQQHEARVAVKDLIAHIQKIDSLQRNLAHRADIHFIETATRGEDVLDHGKLSVLIGELIHKVRSLPEKFVVG